MGKGFSRFDKKEEDYCLEILMLGLNGAGKTTILNYLDGNSDEIPAPTITPSFSAGTNLSKGLDGLSISIWDFSGDERFRQEWMRFVREPQVLLFVVDSADTSRIKEVSQYLISILEHPKIEGIPVLILANKQDLPAALSLKELAEKLSLAHYTANPCAFQRACSLTGKGLYEAIYKLADMDTKTSRSKRSLKELGPTLELGGFSPEVVKRLGAKSITMRYAQIQPLFFS